MTILGEYTTLEAALSASIMAINAKQLSLRFMTEELRIFGGGFTIATSGPAFFLKPTPDGWEVRTDY